MACFNDIATTCSINYKHSIHVTLQNNAFLFNSDNACWGISVMNDMIIKSNVYVESLICEIARCS